MAKQYRKALAAYFALSLALLASDANSQPMGGGRGQGMMMGPHVFGGERMGRMCGPGSAGFVQWRTERIEALKLTDAQRAKFDVLKAASAKATDASRAACGRDCNRAAPDGGNGEAHGGHASQHQGGTAGARRVLWLAHFRTEGTA